MPDVLYLLAVLACPIMMGTMMLVMMRGNHHHHTTASTGEEVARLRAEVEQLRDQSPGDQSPVDEHSADTPNAS